MVFPILEHEFIVHQTTIPSPTCACRKNLAACRDISFCKTNFGDWLGLVVGLSSAAVGRVLVFLIAALGVVSNPNRSQRRSFSLPTVMK